LIKGKFSFSFLTQDEQVVSYRVILFLAFYSFGEFGYYYYLKI
jgi:hypothetical protein